MVPLVARRNRHHSALASSDTEGPVRRFAKRRLWQPHCAIGIVRRLASPPRDTRPIDALCFASCINIFQQPSFIISVAPLQNRRTTEVGVVLMRYPTLITIAAPLLYSFLLT